MDNRIFGVNPKPRQTIQVGIGKANFANNFTSYAAMTVSAPFIRASAIVKGSRPAGGFYRPYAVGTIADHGEITVQEVMHEDGTIIMLQVSGKSRGMPIRDGVLFIRLRTDGPRWEVFGRLPPDHHNRLGDKASIFVGAGDMLSARDLEEYGVVLSRSYREKFMQPEEVDECFIISRLSTGTPRPSTVTVHKDDGTAVVKEIQAPRKRRLMMGRKS